MKIKRVKFKDIEQLPNFNINKNFKQNFQGSSPAPFIGRFGYPKINIGFLSPQISGDTSNYDSPSSWSKNNSSINNIASLRYGLVNSRTQNSVKDLQNNSRFLEIIQEVGMASKPVELEVNLNKIPKLDIKLEKEVSPFGPASKLDKAKITSNTKVDSRVERIVSDTDLKAAPGILSLYKKGFDENFLTKLISTANTGLKNNRKLVPTRWSITAIDDTIGKQLITEIKDYSPGEFQAYFSGEWGNYYLILFFPEVWGYELFESYVNYQVNPWSKAGYFYSTDYENYAGRKTYAEETAGGYYACRIGVLEKLKALKRQGSVLALRFITSEYNIPLGVWVCREASRKSLAEKPITFSSEELMLRYAKLLIQKKFGFDIEVLLKESKLLKQNKEQSKLNKYF
ncbi:MAG: hypothetical protein ABIH82_04025 [Candidatus Woesearchaeota archaeon]